MMVYWVPAEWGGGREGTPMRRELAGRYPRGRPPGASRRAFLARIGGATAAALGASVVGVPSLQAADSPAGVPAAPQPSPARAQVDRPSSTYSMHLGRPTVLDALHRDDFSRHLHSRFRIYDGSAGPLEVELVEATDGP